MSRPPVPFPRGDVRRLRIRVSVLAMAFGMFDRQLLQELDRFRLGLPGEVVERLAVQFGLDAIGVYLDERRANAV